jgi:hypothetical protein
VRRDACRLEPLGREAEGVRAHRADSADVVGMQVRDHDSVEVGQADADDPGVAHQRGCWLAAG